jgi:hypothetical protein
MVLAEWFNLAEYEARELIVFGAGCVFWFIAYMKIILNIIKKKVIEMPYTMVCANIAWEFLWGFVFITNMGDFFVWAYRGWFFFDLFILWGTYRYGAKQVTIPEVAKRFSVVLTLCLASAFVLLYFFIRQHDDAIGALSAYIINALTSAIYITMILRSTSPEDYSPLVAWTKMLGTGMVSVFVLMHWPGDHILLALAAFSFVADIVYIIILRSRIKLL